MITAADPPFQALKNQTLRGQPNRILTLLHLQGGKTGRMRRPLISGLCEIAANILAYRRHFRMLLRSLETDGVSMVRRKRSPHFLIISDCVGYG